MKKYVIISILVLVLALGVIIYNVSKPTKEINMHEARVNVMGSNNYIELIEKNEKAVIDDKLTIEFYGVEDSIDIYTYTAKIYYDGKLIKDNVFTNPERKIIRHSSSQIGGFYVEKINNIYFISSTIKSPSTGSAVLVLNNGNIINSFEWVFFEIDTDDNKLVVYDTTTIDNDKIEDDSKSYYQNCQLYCKSREYKILDDRIERIKN